jgi:GAF domain-containing protein
MTRSRARRASRPFGWSRTGRRLLGEALDEAVRLLGADGGLVYLRDRDPGELRFALDIGISERAELAWVRRLRLSPGVGMFGRAVADGRVGATGDYMSDPSFTHASSTDRVVREVGMRSLVVAPLSAGSQVIGAIGVYSARRNAFGEGDIALVRALAGHAATTIENTRLIRELAGGRRELAARAAAERALREIAGRITALREPGEVLQLTVDAAARLLKADGARIDLLEPGSGALHWAYDAASGRRPGLGPIDGPGEAEADEGISGRAVAERRPVWTGDYLADRRFLHAAAPDAFAGEHGIRSAIAAPLMSDAGPIGTLTVYTSENDAFGAPDATLIQALADQAAIAITNASLIDQLNSSRDDLAHRADAERALRELAGTIIALRDPKCCSGPSMPPRCSSRPRSGRSACSTMTAGFAGSRRPPPMPGARPPAMPRTLARAARPASAASPSVPEASCAPRTTSPTRASATSSRSTTSRESTASARPCRRRCGATGSPSAS